MKEGRNLNAFQAVMLSIFFIWALTALGCVGYFLIRVLLSSVAAFLWTFGIVFVVAVVAALIYYLDPDL